jgi:formate hydrogenlyase subunit 6/NADH:ubiquinone oxidoreductase subunit I
MRFFRNRLVPKPFINTDRCLRCGICVRMCPAEPKAVDWISGNKKKPPVYDYRRCIRCYCCQEVCPEKAIRLKKPLLRRLFPR